MAPLRKAFPYVVGPRVRIRLPPAVSLVGLSPASTGQVVLSGPATELRQTELIRHAYLGERKVQ